MSKVKVAVLLKENDRSSLNKMAKDLNIDFKSLRSKKAVAEAIVLHLEDSNDVYPTPIWDEDMGQDKMCVESSEGDSNLPPLELSQVDEKELLDSQDKMYSDAAERLSKESVFSNGVNEWRLIQRTFNPVLNTEQKTMAMQIGTRAVLIAL